MADGMFLRGLANLCNKEVDLEADAINVLLLLSTWTPDQTLNVYADLIASEVATGAGYTTGGVALAGKAVTQADPTKWDATDSQWLALTKAFRYAVVYDDTPAGAGNVDPLISWYDLGTQSVTAVTLNIIWNAAGLVTLTPP